MVFWPLATDFWPMWRRRSHSFMRLQKIIAINHVLKQIQWSRLSQYPSKTRVRVDHKFYQTCNGWSWDKIRDRERRMDCYLNGVVVPYEYQRVFRLPCQTEAVFSQYSSRALYVQAFCLPCTSPENTALSFPSFSWQSQDTSDSLARQPTEPQCHYCCSCCCLEGHFSTIHDLPDWFSTGATVF